MPPQSRHSQRWGCFARPSNQRCGWEEWVELFPDWPLGAWVGYHLTVTWGPDWPPGAWWVQGNPPWRSWSGAPIQVQAGRSSQCAVSGVHGRVSPQGVRPSWGREGGLRGDTGGKAVASIPDPGQYPGFLGLGTCRLFPPTRRGHARRLPPYLGRSPLLNCVTARGGAQPGGSRSSCEERKVPQATGKTVTTG